MLKKIVSLGIVSQTILYSQNFLEDKYLQIVANNLEIKNNIISASGDVVAYSGNYYITADKLIYDKNSTIVELFDDVNIVKNNEVLSFSDYTYMNMKDEISKFKPFFMLDNSNKLWFNSETTSSEKNNYKLKNSTISSCDCKDPSWSIGFSSGDYNTTKQWINTYNTTLYIKNFPILYTPYFGFPTNNTRKSGLLKPTLGWSHNEGFQYAQPIYLAFKENYDFEYIPQIRNQRGYGHAFKYRYKDSLYSILDIEGAYFREKDSYQKRMSLENSEHNGFNISYKRDKLFSKTNSDGLIINLVDMSDVDYINTKYDNDTMTYTDKFLESKVKYFFNTNSYYSDVSLQFYNDISKDNNDDVMQSLPSINLHKYINNIFFNNLVYSVDLNFEKQTRNIGLSADTTKIDLPFSYNFSLFDDYLNLNLTEEIKYTNVHYTNNDKEYQDVNYGEVNHILNLYTDLLKPYDKYLHTFKFDTSLVYSDEIKEDGDIYTSEIDNSDLETFAISKTNKNLSIGFNQSLYNKESLREIVNHKIKQSYVFNKQENQYEKINLENDITVFHNYGKVSNRLLYNHALNKIVNSSITSKFIYNDYSFNVNYLYSKDDVTLRNQENINYDFGFSFYKYYKGTYKEEYDLTSKIVKKREYSLNIDKKCWGINLKLVDSLVATNTIGVENKGLRQDIVYIEFNLKQLFKLKQVYKFDERNE